MKAKIIYKLMMEIKIKESKSLDHISKDILPHTMDLMEILTMELTGETHTTEKSQITMLIQKSQIHSPQK
jgi:hypothetical protein